MTTSNVDLKHETPATDTSSMFNLRKRSSEHPMAMFAVMAGCALSAMAFIPTTGPALASFGSPMTIDENVRIAKVSELPVSASADLCSDQDVAHRDNGCVIAIAHDTGKGDRVTIRRLASAEQLAGAANVY